jgi:peptidoglycan/LPS O-acetylase OafA/YrhL
MSGVGSRSTRLPLIDSLRAGAALLIFGYHALFVTGTLSRNDYGWFLNVGVPLFYGISGLLLFKPFSDAIVNGTASPNIRAYGRHRLFRILPAYWLALPIVAVLLGRTAQVFSFEGLVRYFGLTQAYSLDTFVGGIGQAWTLTVEVAFYVFLPFWAWLCARAVRGTVGPEGRARRLLMMIAAAVGLSIAWKVGVVLHFGNDIASALVPLTALPAALDQFCVGMAIAVLVSLKKAGVTNRVLTGFAKRPALGVLIALLAYWLIGEIYGIGPLRNHPLGGWGANTILEHEGKALVAGGLLLAGVTAIPGVGLVGHALNWRPLRWVGEVSYGVYLWHLAILTVLAGNANWALGSHGLIANPSGVGVTASAAVIVMAVVVSLAATLLIAWLSWGWVEKYFIRRSHSRRTLPVSTP